MTICDIDWCVSSLGFCLTNFFKAHGNKSWYLRDETCIWEMGAEDIETFQQVSLSTCAWYDYIVTICHLHQWQLITSFHVRRVPSTFRPSRDKRFKMPWSFLVLPSTKVLESLTSGRHRAHRHGSMAAKQRSHGKLRLQGRRLKKNLKLEMLSTSLFWYSFHVRGSSRYLRWGFTKKVVSTGGSEWTCETSTWWNTLKYRKTSETKDPFKTQEKCKGWTFSLNI